MIDYWSQHQAWQQAIQQQQARYQQQLQQAVDLAAYHQALTMPRQYGYGAMANPLLSRASVPLFQPTAAGNPLLAEALSNAGQAGDTGTSSSPLAMQSVGMP